MNRPADEPRISCTGCLTRYSVELIRCPRCHTATKINRDHWDGVRAGRTKPSVETIAVEVMAWVLIGSLACAALIVWGW